MANGRCRIHGGKSLVGAAAGPYRNGRYSKYLPTRMLERYEDAATDTELIALREDVALIDARIADMLQRVDTGECGETWKALQEAVHEFDKAERGMNAASSDKTIELKRIDREEAMRTIIVLVQEGMADYAAWREIGSLIEQRRKTVETEQKRLIAMQQVITNDRAMVMMDRMLDIIERNVTDRSIRSAITSEFRAMSLATGSRSA
jgi:hypothetical protein